MLISEAIPEFALWMANSAHHEKKAHAGKYDPKTIELYTYFVTCLKDFFHDRPVESITYEDLEEYRAYLGNDEKPPRKDKKKGPLSGSTLQKHHLALKLFFDWATPALSLDERPDQYLSIPRRNSNLSLPFKKVEVDTLLQVITTPMVVKASTEEGTRKRAAYTVDRATKHRDLALVFLLLDTGLTISRICKLTVADFFPDEQKIRVTIEKWDEHGMTQFVFFLKINPHTCQAITQHLSKRKIIEDSQPLIAGLGLKTLTYNAVRCLFLDLRKKIIDADKTKGFDITGGRFQATYAITYLDSGGDPLTLKYILGHEYLTGLKRYLKMWTAIKEGKDIHCESDLKG